MTKGKMTKVGFVTVLTRELIEQWPEIAKDRLDCCLQEFQDALKKRKSKWHVITVMFVTEEEE